MWISRGVPKNFSRIAHGFCWSTWSIQYRGGRGAWLLTSKQPSVQNSVLKYSTHGFDQTDLMSLKLLYPLIKHILPDGLLLLMLVRWKAEKIKRDLFARPLSEQLSQQTQNLILTMIICSITRYLARYATLFLIWLEIQCIHKGTNSSGYSIIFFVDLNGSIKEGSI